MQAIGDVTLALENNSHLEFKDCLYVPKSRKNLVSVSSLNNCKYLVYFNKNVSIRKSDSFICSGSLVDILFHFIPISILQCVKIIKSH